MRLLLVVLMLLGIALPVGCAGTGPYAPVDPERRDTAKAERLTREAADLIASEPDKAEALLREALTADLFHGPAHNNLGVIYFNAGRLYEAAGEFEWARKLMPGHPDPRLNLGLALEQGGRIDEAIDAYDSALQAAPKHLPAIQALASCEIRHGKTNAQTESLLNTIALRGDRRWKQWARDQLLTVARRN